MRRSWPAPTTTESTSAATRRTPNPAGVTAAGRDGRGSGRRAASGLERTMAGVGRGPAAGEGVDTVRRAGGAAGRATSASDDDERRAPESASGRGAREAPGDASARFDAGSSDGAAGDGGGSSAAGALADLAADSPTAS